MDQSQQLQQSNPKNPNPDPAHAIQPPPARAQVSEQLASRTQVQPASESGAPQEQVSSKAYLQRPPPQNQLLQSNSGSQRQRQNSTHMHQVTPMLAQHNPVVETRHQPPAGLQSHSAHFCSQGCCQGAPLYQPQDPHEYTSPPMAPDARQVIYQEMPQNYEKVQFCCDCDCPVCHQEAAMQLANQYHQPVYIHHTLAHLPPHPRMHHPGRYQYVEAPHQQQTLNLNLGSSSRNLACFQTPLKADPTKKHFQYLESPLSNVDQISPKNQDFRTPDSDRVHFTTTNARLPERSPAAYPNPVRLEKQQHSQFSDKHTANFASPDALTKQQQHRSSDQHQGSGDDQINFQTYTPSGLLIQSNKKNAIKSDHIASSHKIQFTEVCQGSSADEVDPQHLNHQVYTVHCYDCFIQQQQQQYQQCHNAFLPTGQDENEESKDLPVGDNRPRNHFSPASRESKRDRKSAEKLQIKHSRSMNLIKVPVSGGPVTEVKLKKSPSTNRLGKPHQFIGADSKRKRKESANKENERRSEFEQTQRPPQPGHGPQIAISANTPAVPDVVLQQQVSHPPQQALQESGIKRASPITCNCKQSHCLKRYCECLKNGRVCTSACQCCNCENLPGNPKREEFLQILKQKKQLMPSSAGQQLFCRCSNSKCKQRYCECFQAGIACNDKCGCKDCENPECGSDHEHHQPARPEPCKTELPPRPESSLPPQPLILQTPSQRTLPNTAPQQSQAQDSKQRQTSSSAQQATRTTTANSKQGGAPNSRSRIEGELSALKPKNLGPDLAKNKQKNKDSKPVAQPQNHQVHTRMSTRKQSQVQQSSQSQD